MFGKLIQLTAAVIMIAVPGFAQYLTGTVIDSKTKAKISGVTVKVIGSSKTATTGSAGTFAITAPPSSIGSPDAPSVSALPGFAGPVSVVFYTVGGKRIGSSAAMLPDGVYLKDIRGNGIRSLEKITVVGSRVTSRTPPGSAGAGRGKSAAAAQPLQAETIFSDGLDVTMEFLHKDYYKKTVAARYGQSVNVLLEKLPVYSSGSRPGPHNTGPTGSLTNYTGSSTITKAGLVIENKIIKGSVQIKASNVTIRNCKIVGGWYGVQCTYGAKNLVIEDSEITQHNSAGVYGRDFTLRRCELHNGGADGIKPQGNMVVEGCWIHTYKVKAYWPNDAPHADGIQIRGGSNFTLKGTFLDLGENSVCPLMLQLNFSNFLAEGNWFYTRANYIINQDKKQYSCATNVRFINNTIIKGYTSGIKTTRGCSVTWSGNVFADTGAPAN